MMGGSDFLPHRTPPTVVPAQIPNLDTISNITGPSAGSPIMPASRLVGAEIGLPPTPDRTMVLCLNSEQIDEGYDSEGWAGPCTDLVDKEGELMEEEEEVIALPVAETDAEKNSENRNSITNENEKDDYVLLESEVDKMLVSRLKQALVARNLSRYGMKQQLIDRLKEAIRNNIPLANLQDPEVLANMAGVGFATTAHWELLESNDNDVVQDNLFVEGIQFRAPTTNFPLEDIAQQAQKKNYAEIFDKPPFIQKVWLPKRNARGRIMTDGGGKVIYDVDQYSDQTVPNIEFIHANDLSVDSHPVKWFDLFMPMHRKRQAHPSVCTISDFTTWTNKKAFLCNAGEGGSLYPRWTPFSLDEVARHLGLYILQGLSPSPQIEMKFVSQKDDPVNGNDFVAASFGLDAKRRHKEFKAFFASVDPLKAIPARATHPNWKVQHFFKHAIRISKQCIFLGKKLSLDEQTIGCQGRHPDILRITYKKEGDGFQCDAICSDGYTYSFYFRNQPAPKTFLDMGMSPLHARVHSLFDQLPGQHYDCAMDNLYMSAKLCRSSWRCKQKVMIYGVARSDKRGVPKCVEQKTYSKREDVEKARGTLKVAHLKGYSNIDGLIAILLYDTKPFYMLSNASEKVEWKKKEKKCG